MLCTVFYTLAMGHLNIWMQYTSHSHPLYSIKLHSTNIQYSVQSSRSVVSDSLRPHESQHTRPPCPSPTPRVYSNSCPSSQWCHPAISSSVIPFSSCPQSLPASGSFPMSQLLAWGGRSMSSIKKSMLNCFNSELMKKKKKITTLSSVNVQYTWRVEMKSQNSCGKINIKYW